MLSDVTTLSPKIEEARSICCTGAGAMTDETFQRLVSLAAHVVTRDHITGVDLAVILTTIQTAEIAAERKRHA